MTAPAESTKYTTFRTNPDGCLVLWTRIANFPSKFCLPTLCIVTRNFAERFISASLISITFHLISTAFGKTPFPSTQASSIFRSDDASTMNVATFLQNWGIFSQASMFLLFTNVSASEFVSLHVMFGMKGNLCWPKYSQERTCGKDD